MPVCERGSIVTEKLYLSLKSISDTALYVRMYVYIFACLPWTILLAYFFTIAFIRYRELFKIKKSTLYQGVLMGCVTSIILKVLQIFFYSHTNVNTVCTIIVCFSIILLITIELYWNKQTNKKYHWLNETLTSTCFLQIKPCITLIKISLHIVDDLYQKKHNQLQHSKNCSSPFSFFSLSIVWAMTKS